MLLHAVVVVLRSWQWGLQAMLGAVFVFGSVACSGSTSEGEIRRSSTVGRDGGGVDEGDDAPAGTPNGEDLEPEPQAAPGNVDGPNDSDGVPRPSANPSPAGPGVETPGIIVPPDPVATGPSPTDGGSTGAVAGMSGVGGGSPAPSSGAGGTGGAVASGGQSAQPDGDQDQSFDIDLVFENESAIEPVVLDAFYAARSRWQRVIVGDLPDVSLSANNQCGGYDLPSRVDDVVIFVSLASLDGPEGLLGAAGPCAIRSGGARLPFAGVMEFDSDDLETFAEAGRLEEIVLHEMGHVLGIGSLWENFGLLTNPSDGSGEQDTAFRGEEATLAFDAVGGTAYTVGEKVPVENVGGEGEINGHWRESVLGVELMTSAIGAETARLSAVTLGSLVDLGYDVFEGSADDYSWPSSDEPFSFRVVGKPEPVGIDLSRDRLNLPLLELGPDGELRPLQGR